MTMGPPHTRSGQRGVADDGDISDVHAIHNAVEHVDKLCQHGGNRQTQNKTADRVMSQIVCSSQFSSSFFRVFKEAAALPLCLFRKSGENGVVIRRGAAQRYGAPGFIQKAVRALPGAAQCACPGVLHAIGQ